MVGCGSRWVAVLGGLRWLVGGQEGSCEGGSKTVV